MKFSFCVGLFAFVGLAVVDQTSGHGRLVDPVSRSTMWRQGFNNPPDYDDTAGYCGGFAHQYGPAKGKCGICGDPYDARPREHEAPDGKYANGIIVKTYKAGQKIKAKVEVTANHRGFFEFKLCPNNNINKDPTMECFDKNTLLVGPAFNTKKYFIPKGDGIMVTVELQLPRNLKCSQCILQWTYTAGNNWGICADGTGALGCGPQEHFRACSDIKIV